MAPDAGFCLKGAPEPKIRRTPPEPYWIGGPPLYISKTLLQAADGYITVPGVWRPDPKIPRDCPRFKWDLLLGGVGYVLGAGFLFGCKHS